MDANASSGESLGHAVEYARLVAFFERLEATTKRLEMTGILVELLDAIDPSEMEATVRLLQGAVRPDWEGVELGLAEKMILRALTEATAHKEAAVLATYHQAGDLGEAARLLLEGATSQQSTLFGPDPLTIQSAYDRLLAIAKVQGAGSQDKKLALLAKLLSDASGAEAKFLIRTVAGRLRLGVADLTFLDALAAWHLGRGVRSVQDMEPEEREAQEDARRRLERGFDVTSDLAGVAVALSGGLAAVDALHVAHGVPLRPMAAERLKTVAEILEKHDGRSAVEYKYDGLRLQCHVSPDGVRLFSRRLEELTDQFPDVQRFLADALRGPPCIVEGEVLAIDLATDRLRPFQEISRRRGRKTGLGEDARKEAGFSDVAATATMMDEVPVAVFLFDCLAVDGVAVFDEPYTARRERLSALFAMDERVRLSTMQICEDEGSIEAFFQQAVQEGAEGIMCKAPAGVYKAGNRGFDWIKYKTDYTAELVDTLDLVAIGAFYGRGRRAGWYGALLMACRNADTGRFESVCKLGTGFDDETLQGLKDHFATHAAAAKPRDVDSDMVPDVWFDPAIVMEVQAAEITLSPVHKAAWGRHRADSGLAARFPRFTRWRDDKGPDQATSTAEVERMYEQQGKR